MKKYKYRVYWDVTIDGVGTNLELKGLYESDSADPDEVMIEVDGDPDLIGEDFIGYPTDDEEHDVVWEGFPIVFLQETELPT
jgi:hypothetical protein